MRVTFPQAPSNWLPRRLRWPQCAVLLLAVVVILAALLRVWALDASPLWWDEGNNAYFAHQTVGRILEVSRATNDTDPPAHRLALALWLRLLGDSALNLRLLSAVLGVATVLLVYRWTRWLAGPGAALLAATLTALSPTLVYYSREAKAYPFVTLFGLLALYIWFRWLDGPQRPRPFMWVLFVLCEVLALGAHYYAVFLVVAQGTWLAVDVARQRAWRRGGLWLAAQGVVGAVLLLWVVPTQASALEGIRAVSTARSLTLLAYLRDVLATLGTAPGAAHWAAAVALPVLGVGVGAGWAKGNLRVASLLSSLALLPILFGFIAQSRLSFFGPRLLLYSVPLLCMAAALGLSRLRAGGLVLSAGLVAVWLVALPAAFAPAAAPQEDLRPLAAVLRAEMRPGDGVVVSYIWQEGILRMLAPAAPVTYHLGWFTKGKAPQQVGSLLEQHPRLWLVTYRAPLQHPQNPGGWWLEHHAARGMVTAWGNGRIVLYLAPPAEAGLGPRTAAFEDEIKLSYRPIDEKVAPGQPFVVPLSWTADVAPSAAYSVFVHLYDGAGKLWTQQDGAPVNGLKPFPRFASQEVVADYRVLSPPLETPAGEYTISAGVYNPATGQRLKLLGGAGADSVVIGSIQVVPKER